MPIVIVKDKEQLGGLVKRTPEPAAVIIKRAPVGSTDGGVVGDIGRGVRAALADEAPFVIAKTDAADAVMVVLRHAVKPVTGMAKGAGAVLKTAYEQTLTNHGSDAQIVGHNAGGFWGMLGGLFVEKGAQTLADAKLKREAKKNKK